MRASVKTSLLRATTLAALIGLGACSDNGANGFPESSPNGSGGAVAASDGAGTVGAELTLPSGQLIEVVQWAITGPNGAVTVVQSGSVNVSASKTVSFLASGIAAGTGYRITISGTAIDGSVTCSGSASFDVMSHATTRVPVALGCSVATAGSQVTLVSGESFNCATVTNVTAVPAETAVGGTIALSATAAGPMPSALSYAWSAPSGSFDRKNAATANFSCTAVGPVPLTLTAADGPVPADAACNSMLSTKTITIQCDALQEAGTDAGTSGTDAGESGPDAGDAGTDGGEPPVVPALPGSGIFILALAMLGVGSLGSRRRDRNVQ